jgi:hypothetical protein
MDARDVAPPYYQPLNPEAKFLLEGGRDAHEIMVFC